MRKKDFEALAMELGNRLAITTQAFFAEKGMTFDEEAYWSQSSIDRSTIAMEMLFFGADQFPLLPDDDEARSGDPQRH